MKTYKQDIFIVKNDCEGKPFYLLSKKTKAVNILFNNLHSEKVFRNPHLGMSFLKKAAKECRSYDCFFLFSDKLTSSLLTLAYLKGVKNYVLFTHPNTPNWIIGENLRHEDRYVRQKIAERHDLTPEQYRKLGRDSCYFVKFSVASNPSTPKDELERLFSFKTERRALRNALASNTSLPHELFNKLGKDKKRYDFILVGNESTPPEILENILQEDNYLAPRALLNLKKRFPEIAKKYEDVDK